LALTRERKEELVEQYEAWMKESKALVLAEYTGLNMIQLDSLRAKVREAGAEFHVVKNRLSKRVFEAAGLDVPEEMFIGSTAFGIAFQDAPGIAKVIKDFGKDNPALKIKAGYMDGRLLSADQVNALAISGVLVMALLANLFVLRTPAAW